MNTPEEYQQSLGQCDVTSLEICACFVAMTKHQYWLEVLFAYIVLIILSLSDSFSRLCTSIYLNWSVERKVLLIELEHKDPTITTVYHQILRKVFHNLYKDAYTF